MAVTIRNVFIEVSKREKMTKLDKPVVVQYKPYRQEVSAGKAYLWCSCGLSKNQPFCDYSHVDTEFKPVRYVAKKTGTALFCGCKHTKNAPFCDGSHNDLADEYVTDDRPLEELLRTTTEVEFDSLGRAQLDGNCYVQRPQGVDLQSVGGLQLASVISSNEGARFLDQYSAVLTGAESDVLSFGDSDVVLYVISGAGRVNIGGKDFSVSSNSGAHIRCNEAFQISRESDTDMRLLLTVCPGQSSLKILDQMPKIFVAEYPNRAVAFDLSKRNTMADRFYQILVGEDIGSAEVSQFIGEVPKSKAAPHRHLYEEAILILSAKGIMWTETKRTPVEAGDIIFLPAEQEHSLECTDESGMILAGHFYPSGAPNINY